MVIAIPSSSGRSVHLIRKRWNGFYSAEDRQLMMLASGGATRVSRPVSTQLVPGRRTGTAAVYPATAKPKGAARRAGRSPLSWPSLVSVRGWIERKGHESGEDLLVDDEGHCGDIEHGKRREGHPHYPLPALRPLLGDPAPHRRQPEN